jgi:hypothetical protein
MLGVEDTMRLSPALRMRIRGGAGALIAIGAVACGEAPSDTTTVTSTNTTLASSGSESTVASSDATTPVATTTSTASTASTTNASYPQVTEDYPPPCGRG